MTGLHGWVRPHHLRMMDTEKSPCWQSGRTLKTLEEWLTHADPEARKYRLVIIIISTALSGTVPTHHGRLVARLTGLGDRRPQNNSTRRWNGNKAVFLAGKPPSKDTQRGRLEWFLSCSVLVYLQQNVLMLVPKSPWLWDKSSIQLGHQPCGWTTIPMYKQIKNLCHPLLLVGWQWFSTMDND